jgi:polysaccharide export outer membrane protein
MGQVKKPGSYKFTQKDLTLVGAIGNAGGFTNIAARKKTRIIRVENGVEKIITVNVDAITSAGRKIQDIRIKPDDIIIVPQSFF